MPRAGSGPKSPEGRLILCAKSLAGLWLVQAPAWHAILAPEVTREVCEGGLEQTEGDETLLSVIKSCHDDMMPSPPIQIPNVPLVSFT